MKGDNVDIISFDFSKAFDMVSHCYLLVKMKENSIYFKIFFDRIMKVKIGNTIYYFLDHSKKKITQRNRNKLSYLEDIWKLKFNTEKSKNIAHRIQQH